MGILKLIKIALIGLLISCGKAKTEESPIQPTQTDLNYQQVNELLNVLKNKESLFEVKHYCEKTGGVFSQSQPYCSCPINMQFVGQGLPGCYAYNEINLPLEGRNRQLSKSDSTAAYPVDFSFLGTDSNRANQSVLWKPFIHVPKEIDFYDLKEQDVKKLLGFYDISNEPNQLSTFHDIVNIALRVGGTSNSTLSLYQQVKKHLNRDIFVGQTAFEALLLKPWKQINYHARKCLVHCEFEREFSNSTSYLKWTRVLRGGQHFREWIEIRGKDDYFNQYSILVEEKNKDLLVTGVVKLNITEKFGKIQNEVMVFQNGKARTFYWDILNNLSHKENVYKDEASDRFRNKESKILLCDSDISLEQLSDDEKEKVALFTKDKTESFYGLLRSQNSTVRRHLDLINANRNGVLHTSGNGHGASLLKYADDASVIPMALFPCLSLVNQWATNASVKGVRVVNLSAADEVHDMNACRRKEYSANIERHGLGFLWVMSADNWSKEVTATKSTSCPQKALYQNKNVIIASHPKMEFGANFVDVIVSRNQFGYASSASESTMIISQIANDLFMSYPKATPAMVKKALILGTDYDPWISHKTRGGGELNVSRSRNILKSLIRTPYMSNEKIIKKHFGYFDDEKGKLKHIQEYYHD